jgi:hypothetical protein
MLFFYNANRPSANQWAARELDEVVGIHGCACFKPKEQWVFISDPGEVYVVGQSYDDYEEPISTSSRAYFSSVKCIAGGHAFATALHRGVYKRVAENHWVQLTDKSIAPGKNDPVGSAGFRDIDGFSEDNLYACGGRGDLWTFDGKKWMKEYIPTDASLEKVCCSDDGNVYILTNRSDLIIGKKSSWRIVRQDLPEGNFESIVSFQSKIFVSTDENIYEFHRDELKVSSLSPPKMDSYANMAAAHGVLLVAGAHDAFLFHEGKWSKIV